MKEEYKYRMIVGAVLLLGAVAMQVFLGGVDSRIVCMVIVVGVVLLGTGMIRSMRYGKGPETDERTKKISAFALSYSWLVTLVLVNVLFLMEEFSVLAMTAGQVLWAVMSVMIAAPILFHWYFRRKGDVE